MKKLIMVCVLCLILTGCGMSKMATNIGTNIGETYQASAAKGEISAEQSIKAWPYISGVIKGVLADDFNLDLSSRSIHIIDRLDELAAKKATLTSEEKGLVIGYFVRLEILAIKDNWDNYGVSIFNMVIKVIGG